MKFFKTAFFLACLSVFLPSCSTMPGRQSENPLFSTANDPVLLPAELEVAMGAVGFQSTLQQYPPYPDARLAAYVNWVGQRLARVCDRPGIEYHFTVADSPVVNAFALPGGYVFITTGLLKRLKSEAELAAVLGHEVGHVVRRHAIKNLQRTLAVELGLDLVLMLADKEKKNRLLEAGGRLAGNLLLLRNSREAELQADEEGLKNASRAGWDPTAMLDVQEMLGTLGNQQLALVTEIVSTHPASGHRIEQIRYLLPRYTGPKVRNPEIYMRAIATLK